ncbi:PLP-dependent aminotransferase family protein [Palleronia caenipelagi]|uniref:PLP-dependent aminotransferase family protein n=1 Tax=Palleronia caenipelagi TaxID=2489174 RepID=A0A547PJV6_9RHOB|nr:PLP-dependent aminotransferase family protein [Palleronia caenipelagi]TRD14413.1 PLP-dependent aminotransferase family protein [Palleronia caenipelagi]
MVIPVETFTLSETGGTIQTRIKRQIVDGILTGRFLKGEKMPSSRQLAGHLGVSRMTVTLAYTDLVADDYLVARGRSGYFVSPTAPAGAPASPSVQRQSDRPRFDWTRALGNRPEPPPTVARPANWRQFPYPFIYGQTDPTLFDSQNWRLCALQALRHKDHDALTADQYGQDDPVLVDVIRRLILPRRGIRAEPDEILITMGAQNALWIAAQLLLTQRRWAGIESPGYPGIRDVLARTRCNTQPIDVGPEGLDPDMLPQTLDVLFTTVSHQCPTNATMPMARRRALLDRAEAQGFVIVEDDYEFELTFERSPTPSLKSMDGSGAVIHIGSFSKSLFPGLRLGYLVADAPFVTEARRLRSTVLRHPPGLVQRTAANFLALGHYDAQIQRLRQAYHGRRALMTSAITEAGLIHAGSVSGGGSCFWMRAPETVDTEVLAERLHARGVVIEPGAAFFYDADPPRHFYRIAYSSIAPARITKGIKMIAKEIDALR